MTKILPVAKPKEAIEQVKRLERIADLQRQKTESLLNLTHVLDKKKTLAEQALEVINNASFAGQLSLKDLKQFEKKAKELKKQYSKLGIQGGITPRAVINRSRSIDIQRCQKEIGSALPIRQDKNGVVVFKTSASKKHWAAYHIVSVQFLGFQSALNIEKNTDKLANSVNRGAIRFDCDCGRHRYWYRYIASVGGFAYGKPETGFPKVRNPQLTGLACKHVLRVMTVLEKSPAMTAYMKQYLSRYRQNANARVQTLTEKQAKKLSSQLKKESWKNKQIRRTKAGVSQKVELGNVFKGGQSIKGSSVKPKDLAKQKTKGNKSDLQKELRLFEQNLALGKISKEVAGQMLQYLKNINV